MSCVFLIKLIPAKKKIAPKTPANRIALMFFPPAAPFIKITPAYISPPMPKTVKTIPSIRFSIYSSFGLKGYLVKDDQDLQTSFREEGCIG